MRKTHYKDTIGKIIISLVLLFVGEGLFNFGLYWPILLSLVLVTRRTYFYALVFGLLLSSVTSTDLGLASLLLVVGLFIFERLRVGLGNNMWLTGLLVFGYSFLTDLILGLSWGVVEGVVNLSLFLLLWRLDFFGDEIHLQGR